jgi:hypothetical protein
MLRQMSDILRFLYWLAVLHLARAVVVLFCVGEVVGVLTLWAIAFVEWQIHDRASYLLMPLGATFLVAIQVALWQFIWLRLAQRGGKWRALAEWFCSAIRYPIVRPPLGMILDVDEANKEAGSRLPDPAAAHTFKMSPTTLPRR